MNSVSWEKLQVLVMRLFLRADAPRLVRVVPLRIPCKASILMVPTPWACAWFTICRESWWLIVFIQRASLPLLFLTARIFLAFCNVLRRA